MSMRDRRRFDDAVDAAAETVVIAAVVAVAAVVEGSLWESWAGASVMNSRAAIASELVVTLVDGVVRLLLKVHVGDDVDVELFVDFAPHHFHHLLRSRC